MTEQTDLKPCPFCGGEAVISQYGDNRKSTIVECTECACRLENGGDFDGQDPEHFKRASEWVRQEKARRTKRKDTPNDCSNRADPT